MNKDAENRLVGYSELYPEPSEVDKNIFTEEDEDDNEDDESNDLYGLRD